MGKAKQSYETFRKDHDHSFIYPPIYKQLQTFISQYEKSLKVSDIRSSIPSAQQDPPPGNGGVSSTDTGKSSTFKVQISPFSPF